jgi:hypothetical protein
MLVRHVDLVMQMNSSQRASHWDLSALQCFSVVRGMRYHGPLVTAVTSGLCKRAAFTDLANFDR